jgi:hypothetical protein
VRQLAAAFAQASLLAWTATERDGREQARWEKAAASCRTPKLRELFCFGGHAGQFGMEGGTARRSRNAKFKIQDSRPWLPEISLKLQRLAN